MKVNLPVLISQFDPAHSQLLLGLNTDQKYNIYNYGCLLVSLVMICRYYGKNETVASLNEKLKGVGGFVQGGLYVWGSLTKIYPDIVEQRVQTPYPLSDTQLNEIKGALDQKYPVVAMVDYDPKTLTIDTHFLTIVDYDPADENNITSADPLGGKLVPLKAYFSWAKFGVRKIIEQYIVFKGPVPTGPQIEVAPPTPMTIPQPSVEPTPPQPIPEPSKQPETVPSIPQPSAETSTTPNPATLEPSPAVQPEEKPTEPQADQAANAKMASVFTSVVEYLEIEKDPKDTVFEDVRRRIAGIKSTSTDYWNRKEEAERKLVLVEPTIKTLTEEVGILKDELTRRDKAHKAEVEAIEASSNSPRNIRRQFDAIYGELKKRFDEQFETTRTLREDNALLKRQLQIAENQAPSDQSESPQTEPLPEPKVVTPKKPVDKRGFLFSIIESIRSYFISDDLE